MTDTFPYEDLPLPKSWPALVRSAVLHAIALAHAAVTHVRGMCLDSRIARLRLAARLDRAEAEIARLREESRIKDARMAAIDPRRRPHYPPVERMAILEMGAQCGWSLQQTANVFLAMRGAPGSGARILRRQAQTRDPLRGPTETPARRQAAAHRLTLDILVRRVPPSWRSVRASLLASENR